MAKNERELRFRAPEPLKDWLKAKAKANRRSLNGELIHRLEAAMTAEAGRPMGGAPATEHACQG